MTADLETKIAKYIRRHPEQSYTEMARKLKMARSTLAKVGRKHGIVRREPVSPDLKALDR
jgi:DNA-binding MurR/RpiR family transcriptional regulator